MFCRSVFVAFNRMPLNQVVCVMFFIAVQAPVGHSGDPIVNVLKDRVLALETSLMTDIKLLKLDMNRISDELSRLPALLKESLVEQISQSSGNVKQTLGSHIASSYMRDEYEQFNSHMKRAFTEEKVHTRQIMKELKSEVVAIGTSMSRLHDDLRSVISGFGERQLRGLTHLEEKPANSTRQLLKQFDNFKTETAVELKQIQTSIQTGITDFVNESFVQAFGSEIQTSVDTMTNTVTSVTKQCVSGFESLALINKQQTSVVNESMAAISLNISNMMEQLVDEVAYIKDKVTFGNGVYTAYPARLVNIQRTPNTVGGRLEVYYDDKWGTVCDDEFGMPDAAVACRMLGFSGALAYKPGAFYGQGEGQTWMDDLYCNGVETSLFDCSRIGAGSPGNENCGHDEDVGVICDFNKDT